MKRRISIPVRILKFFSDPHQFDILIGDIEELYLLRKETRGRVYAYMSFLIDIASCLRRSVLTRESGIGIPNQKPTLMFGNYFKIATRNLRNNPGYSLINTLGLSLGITCCLLLFHYVKHDLSYDQFHEKGNRLFRIITSTNEDKTPTNANGSYATAPAMYRDFPEVENFVRFAKMGQGTSVLVANQERRFYEPYFLFADSSVFKVFSFSLNKGNPATALKEPNSMVLTEAMADKYFPGEDPIGKSLTADPYNKGEFIPFKITGILNPVPDQSHIKFDMLASMNTQKRNFDNWFGFEQVFNYILLKRGADWKELNAKLTDYSAKYMGENNWYNVSIQPMLDIHLKSNLKSEIMPNSSWQRVYVFSGIAILILVIAIINYFTLATARSSRRAREVGVRKTLGAQRKELILQFLSEATMMAVISAVIGLILAELVLPYFDTFTGKHIELLSANQIIYTIPFLLVLIITVSLFSGLYPAVFLSSFLPVKVLKANKSNRKSLVSLRKGLVIFQFCISIILIINTLIIHQQMQLVRETSLTKNGDQIIIIPVNKEIRDHYQTFKQEVKQIHGVLNAGATSSVPTRGSSSQCFAMQGTEDGVCAFTYLVDPDYIRTMGYRLLSGENFDGRVMTDTMKAFVITKMTAENYKDANLNNVVGKDFGTNYFEEGYVKGVVEDFHVYDLHRSMGESIFALMPPRYYNYMAVRINPAMISQTIHNLTMVWNETSISFPFDYFFLDESFRAMHADDQKTGETMTIFAVLAILIGCIGLIGLVSYSVEQKTKEVGVRKVLGASNWSVFLMFAREYSLLILLSIGIGVPLAYYGMNKWLQDFAYKINLTPTTFILGGGITIALVFLAVSWQSWKAATISPVKSLKDE